MRLLKTTNEPFRMPSLAETWPRYGELVAKRHELEAESHALDRERVDLETKIAADRTSDVSAAAAALLGDAPSPKTQWRERLREVRQRHAIVEKAIELAKERIAGERAPASRSVVAKVEPEWRKRLAALHAAATALAEARQQYVDFTYGFEVEDVQWSTLGPLSLHFLGDRDGGALDRLIQDTKHAV